MSDVGPTVFVGIDDTDTLDTPGTNQLARHLVRELAPVLRARIILRHQLLEDPRVPCTKKNGCASIEFHPRQGEAMITIADLAAKLRELILDWIPARSDPGLCITQQIPAGVAEWGQRAKRELLTQSAARTLAAEHDILLEGLAGTQDGIIGALAAVGLMSTRNDGRVVYLDSDGTDIGNSDALDITGPLPVATILARGIETVIDQNANAPITTGTIEVGKKLRPNYREGRIVLYAVRREGDVYDAVRVT